VNKQNRAVAADSKTSADADLVTTAHARPLNQRM
jgi:hypothetical protein